MKLQEILVHYAKALVARGKLRLKNLHNQQVNTWMLEKQKKYASINLFKPLLNSASPEAIDSSIIPSVLTRAEGGGFRYKGVDYIPYSDLPDDESALYSVTKEQVIIGICSILLIGVFLFLNWKTTIIITIAIFTLFYFSDLLFNLYLVLRSFSKNREIIVTTDNMTSIKDDEWPIYTVFCPLYKEHQVVPQFVEAMRKLDYPKDKLQIMLLLEENDTETIDKIRQYNLPNYFEIIVVPHSLPKTKPKALNYGLLYTKGEFVVVYDAEDVPDPAQLKKVICAFKITDKSIGCIQAKLNFYNPNQNLLTKIFTAEYSLWFDLILTGLQSIEAPIPLGGTSNHFRIHDLKALKGWDSFNVTEDCDLGMRLVKQGFKTAILDSTTFEEANSEMNNWFSQRSRWIKGYIQTYLQHMRDPAKFSNTWKKPHIYTFQLVVGGKVLSLFINPIMWFTTICYFAFYSYSSEFIEQFFPLPILYMSMICLIFGNFLYMYYYMIACHRYGYHKLIKYMFFVPFYWLAMSIAGWVALYEFIIKPHYWAKTKHGLHLNTNPMKIAVKPLGGL